MPLLETTTGSSLTISSGTTTTGWSDIVSPAFCDEVVTSIAGNSITIDATGTTAVWRTWVDDALTPKTTDATTGISATNFTLRDTDIIWSRWANQVITSPASATFRIVDGGSSSNVDVQCLPEDSEERRKRAHLAAAKSRLIRTRKRRRTRENGRELLRRLVSAEQWRDFLRYKSIREIGEFAVYEIGCGWIGHVYEIGFDGQPKRKLCLQTGPGNSDGWCPEDRIVAILMALRTDEAGTVAKAGVHGWHTHERERVAARRGHLVRVAS